MQRVIGHGMLLSLSPAQEVYESGLLGHKAPCETLQIRSTGLGSHGRRLVQYEEPTVLNVRAVGEKCLCRQTSDLPHCKTPTSTLGRSPIRVKVKEPETVHPGASDSMRCTPARLGPRSSPFFASLVVRNG